MNNAPPSRNLASSGFLPAVVVLLMVAFEYTGQFACAVVASVLAVIAVMIFSFGVRAPRVAFVVIAIALVLVDRTDHWWAFVRTDLGLRLDFTSRDVNDRKCEARAGPRNPQAADPPHDGRDPAWIFLHPVLVTIGIFDGHQRVRRAWRELERRSLARNSQCADDAGNRMGSGHSLQDARHPRRCVRWRPSAGWCSCVPF